jgi:hypothetical protein
MTDNSFERHSTTVGSWGELHGEDGSKQALRGGAEVVQS